VKKVEAQHSQPLSGPAVRQGKGASVESPQGERIAQLEAMADTSLQAGKLSQLAALTGNSPTTAAQRRMADMAHAAPPDGHCAGGVAQRIAFHERANGTAAVNGLGAIAGVAAVGDTDINVAGYNYRGPQYTLTEETGAASKVALIAQVATTVGGLAHPVNTKFLTKRNLETDLDIQATVTHANINLQWPGQLGKQNTYRGNLDPYILRVPGKTVDGEKLALHYQFGRDSYGYITKVEQDGTLMSMHGGRGQEEFISDQKKALGRDTTERAELHVFSSAHDTENASESIADVASQSITDKELTLYPASKKKGREAQIGKLAERSKRIDAVAKIGGEGARWQCVRDHAAAGKLTNGTRFYTINYHAGSKGYVGMTFEKLWGSWGTDFQFAFNITDDAVRDKLLDLYDLEDGRIEILKDEDLNDADYSLN